jgi:hypothetical protein
MKPNLLISLAAAGCLTVALGAGAKPHPKLTPALNLPPVAAAADYGLGDFRTIEQWQAASAKVETPMDFGLGAYPTLHSWQHASTRTVPLAQAGR